MGIMHLKRFWQKAILGRNNQLDHQLGQNEAVIDNVLLSALGLGLGETIEYVYSQSPSLEQFEQWICERKGGKPSEDTIQRLNVFITEGTAAMRNDYYAAADLLSSQEMDDWNRQGYLIVRNAVPIEDCEAVISAICEHLNIKRYDPATWYLPHKSRQGIMVQLFQHPSLEKIRSSEKIRLAFEQLWGRKDIWLSTDRAGFNPPETDSYKYPGQGLHWDVSLQVPIPFSTQGIVYLSDTAEDQGAFSLVPGFQHKIEKWLSSLSPEENPRMMNLEQLGVKRIAANAGDLIVWQQALPHGSSPNTSDQPRFVQYINYKPGEVHVQPVWK